MQWVFFNPNKQQYDTLRSAYNLHVEGESQQNQFIESTDPGSFYDRTDATQNILQATAHTNWFTIGFNAFIVIMLAASAYLIFKR